MAAKAGVRRLTLEEVLGDTLLEKLDQPCQDTHLCHIAREITNWIFLAPFLRVKAPEVEAIRGKWPFNVPAQNMELLRRWKHKHQRKGKDTYRILCKAFMDAQEVTLAEKVCDVLRNISVSSSDESDEEPSTLPPGADSTHACSKEDPLEDLARHLRMSYGCRPPNFAVLQWPPPPTLKVFNLALIQSQEIVRRTPLEDNLVRLTLRGSVDDIMKRKTAIKLENIFCSRGKKAKVVLIEGAPGAGKSTLSWDIVLKWVARELFQDDFKIVIYIQFRDLDMQSVTEIADLLPLVESKQRDGASAIVDCCGDRVLFVLDGWDEYSLGLQRDSLFEKLICHPEKLGIPLSTVLITSRPIASGELQPYATSRIEIVGFMPDEVGRYFEDVFKDPITVQKLHDHLQERPTIKASCYLPLNAAIVAHLFMELNYTLPTTLHGLFSSLVLSCIIRHLTKESETQPTITSLDELPPDVQEVFETICILAFKGTLCNKVIFSSRDVRSFGLPEDMSTLSLMQVVQSFATGKPSSYHFLHLSIQELLTALRISKLPPPRQVRIFTKLFSQPRFDAVFRFYAAFTKLQTEGIRSIMSRSLRKGNQQRLLNFLHCLYEAQDTSLCCFAFFQLKGRLDLSRITLSPLDLLSLNYFLSCVDSSATESSDSELTVLEVHLSDCKLTPESINSLSYRNRVKFNVSGNGLSSTCVANLLSNCPQLEQLYVMDCSLTYDGVDLFAAALREHTSLEHLDMLRGTDSSRVMHHVLLAILNHRSLQQLNIAYCPVDIKDVAFVLEVNESLRELKIGGDEISNGESVILACSLRKNRTLETLLVHMKYLSRWMYEFVWSLRECHLKTLGVFGIQWTDVPSSQVNTVRRDKGIPPLEVNFYG